VYIGSSTSIGDGAIIEGPTVVGANCVVESGARIRASIIGDYTRVSSIASIEDRIVFAGKFIDPNGDVIDIDESDIGWVLDDARKQWETNALHNELSHTALQV
jgi:mannose-1-phosphate guanylyltransferase